MFQVSKSQFQDYCISHLDSLESSPDQMREGNQHPHHYDSLEDDQEFCDKKLLAINHLYNNSSEAILSVRGTVRGIRNRVRAGIKTFAPENVITGTLWSSQGDQNGSLMSMIVKPESKVSIGLKSQSQLT